MLWHATVLPLLQLPRTFLHHQGDPLMKNGNCRCVYFLVVFTVCVGFLFSWRININPVERPRCATACAWCYPPGGIQASKMCTVTRELFVSCPCSCFTILTCRRDKQTKIPLPSREKTPYYCLSGAWRKHQQRPQQYHTERDNATSTAKEYSNGLGVTYSTTRYWECDIRGFLHISPTAPTGDETTPSASSREMPT